MTGLLKWHCSITSIVFSSSIYEILLLNPEFTISRSKKEHDHLHSQSYSHITPAGCSGPPILCCQGLNNTCKRGCFCDQACQGFRDCCTDYIQTCGGPNTTISTNTTSWTVMSTQPSTTSMRNSTDTTQTSTIITDRLDSSTSTAVTSVTPTSTATPAPWTTFSTSPEITSMSPTTSAMLTSTITRSNPDTTSVSATETPALTFSTKPQTTAMNVTDRSSASTTNILEMKKVILDLKVCTRSRANGTLRLESLQNFAQQLEGMLRNKGCNDCTLKILRIQQKTTAP
ncbi:hypothetical protein AOLI_G00216270 [Acnodon oligacanthus]